VFSGKICDFLPEILTFWMEFVIFTWKYGIRDFLPETLAFMDEICNFYLDTFYLWMKVVSFYQKKH
jgi:hypothetical protein